METTNPRQALGGSRILRQILFLDFDGVLHGEVGERFSRLPLLESALRMMPRLEVVITSTWRLEMDTEELRCRVMGITPHIGSGVDVGNRQGEIEAFLASEGISDHARWIALDDVAPLIEKDGEQLLAWYEATAGNAFRST